MPSADTGPDMELTKPIFRSAAKPLVAAADARAAAVASRMNLIMRGFSLSDWDEESGNQLPLALLQLHDDARALVGAVAAVGLEVVDTVRADQLLRAVDGVVQRHAELRRTGLGLAGDRPRSRVGEQQPGVERIGRGRVGRRDAIALLVGPAELPG